LRIRNGSYKDAHLIEGEYMRQIREVAEEADISYGRRHQDKVGQPKKKTKVDDEQHISMYLWKVRAS